MMTIFQRNTFFLILSEFHLKQNNFSEKIVEDCCYGNVPSNYEISYCDFLGKKHIQCAIK